MTACTDPRPVPVRLGTGSRFQVMCAAHGCNYRTPVVADRKTARQHFTTEEAKRLAALLDAPADARPEFYGRLVCASCGQVPAAHIGMAAVGFEQAPIEATA